MENAEHGRTRGFVVCLVFALLTFALALGARAGERVAVPGLALDDVHHVGPAVSIGGLAVYPIYAAEQEDLGEFVTLQEALEAGKAEVREVGAEAAAPAPASLPVQAPAPNPPPSSAGVAREPIQQQQVLDELPNIQQRAIGAPSQMGGGATVNTLVIENKGDVAILVLAGTIVKGGRQDRQIGQDFVVGPKQTVPVDAFCVEHGRWVATRAGEETQGKFSTVPVLAQKSVRGAGQYEKSQGKVWEKVAEVNAGAGKETGTGTLLATLDDAEVTARREALAKQAREALAAVPDAPHVVGLAWATDGEVRAVRWFASHGVYDRFAPTLLQTAAVEAVTTDAAARPKAAPQPEAVRTFVKAFQDQAATETRETGSGNANTYFETDKGYKSECRLKGEASKRPVTVDFMVK